MTNTKRVRCCLGNLNIVQRFFRVQLAFFLMNAYDFSMSSNLQWYANKDGSYKPNNNFYSLLIFQGYQ